MRGEGGAELARLAGMPDLQRAPGDLPVPVRWSTPQLAALCLIAAVVVVVGWYLRQPDVIAGDDIIYYFLGKSIAAGQYRDLFSVGSPPHVKYPPGMPLWLAAVDAMGLGLPAVQLGHLLMLAATALLVADALRRLQAPWLGVVAAAAVGWNHAMLQYAGTMYSEVLFTLLVTLSLWVLLRAEQVHDVRRRNAVIAMATMVAAAAFLTRSAGIAVLATVPVVLMVHKRWRAAALTALVGLVLVVGWVAYVAQANDSLVGRSYLADMAREPLASTPGGVVGRATANLLGYVVTIMPGTLGLPGIPDFYLDNLLWTVMLGGGLVLGAVVCSRRWPAAPILIICYGLVMLAWPWPLDRLVAPLVPVGIALMLGGAAWLRSRAWHIVPRALPLVGVTAILGLGIVNGNLRRARAIAQCSRVDAWQAPSPCAPPRDHALVAVARSARGVLPHGSVIASFRESAVFYFSGYQTVALEEMDHTLPSVVAAMTAASATHLLLWPIHLSRVPHLARRLAESCAELTAAVPPYDAAVLLAPRRDGDPDACEAIRRVLEWEEAGNGER